MPSIPTGQFITHSAEETFELAYSIGEAITEPAVFLLQGDLGAGKTVFAKGLAAGLEIDPAEVNSPTFTLVNQHEGRMRMYHLDLYRLEGGAEDLRTIGLEEMLNEDAVVVIEWSERLGAFAIAGSYAVSIVDLGGEERKISIDRQILKSEGDNGTNGNNGTNGKEADYERNADL
ncbi:MAG: tRNA (adenosine(37)-N6)-threonylcarbamoyltransferase complex ATPase subunit type 1 TsaE [Blastocatellia bacterium]